MHFPSSGVNLLKSKEKYLWYIFSALFFFSARKKKPLVHFIVYVTSRLSKNAAAENDRYCSQNGSLQKILGAECHPAVTLRQHPEGGRFNRCQYRQRVGGSGQCEGGGLPPSHGDTAPIYPDVADFNRFNWCQYRQRLGLDNRRVVGYHPPIHYICHFFSTDNILGSIFLHIESA